MATEIPGAPSGSPSQLRAARSGSPDSPAAPGLPQPQQLRFQPRPQQGLLSRTLQSHSLGRGGVPLAALAAAAELLVLQGKLDESARSGAMGAGGGSSIALERCDRPVVGAPASFGESPDAATGRPSRKSTEEVAHAVLLHSQRSAPQAAAASIPHIALPAPVNTNYLEEGSAAGACKRGAPPPSQLPQAQACEIPVAATLSSGLTVPIQTRGSDAAQLLSGESRLLAQGESGGSSTSSGSASGAGNSPLRLVAPSESGHLVASLPGGTRSSHLSGLRFCSLAHRWAWMTAASCITFE